MAQYIDKSALIAEIKKKIRTEQGYSSEDAECGYLDCAREILSFIDTLEVKEVDLEKEYKDFVEEDPVYNKLVNGIVGKAIAKHFYELGLKAKGE